MSTLRHVLALAFGLFGSRSRFDGLAPATVALVATASCVSPVLMKTLVVTVRDSAGSPETGGGGSGSGSGM